jgi:hypothetical protein
MRYILISAATRGDHSFWLAGAGQKGRDIKRDSDSQRQDCPLWTQNNGEPGDLTVNFVPKSVPPLMCPLDHWVLRFIAAILGPLSVADSEGIIRPMGISCKLRTCGGV